MPDNQYESRKRWNSANYKQINIAVRPELAAIFRAACEQANIPMREVLVAFMTAYAEAPPYPQKQGEKSYTQRSGRRKAVADIISRLEAIKDAEEQYKLNIPANLRNSSRYESAEQAVEALDEAIGRLADAFS